MVSFYLTMIYFTNNSKITKTMNNNPTKGKNEELTSFCLKWRKGLDHKKPKRKPDAL